MAGEDILIVDDDPFTIELLTESLGERGFRAAAADSGEKAIELLGRRDFSVALVDLRLPGRDGLDIVREMSSVAPDTAILIMTGYPTLDSAIQAIRQGAHDYIVKPFRVEEVIGALEKAIAEQTMRAEISTLRARVRDLEQQLRQFQEGGTPAGGGPARGPGTGTPRPSGGAYGGMTRGPRTG